MGLETIAIASVVVAAVGTGYGIHSSLEQGAQAEKVAKFNAGVEENNALATAQQAQYESQRINKRNRILMGKQNATFGKSGLLGSTREDVQYDSLMEAELERMSVLYTGAIASKAQRSAGQLSRLEGRAAKASAQRRAVSILFQGGGETLDAYGDYKRVRNPDIK